MIENANASMSQSEMFVRRICYPLTRLYARLGATRAQAEKLYQTIFTLHILLKVHVLLQMVGKNCFIRPSGSKTSQRRCLTLIPPVKGLTYLRQKTDATLRQADAVESQVLEVANLRLTV